MPGNCDKHRSDLDRLVKLGERMLIDLSLRGSPVDAEHQEIARQMEGCFETEYQRWYTEAGAVIENLIPSRAGEFEQLYLGNGRRKTLSADTYTIQDWLTGQRTLPHDSAPRSFSPRLAVSMRLKTQLEILKSAEARFDSSLFEMRRLVRADLFSSELDSCRELAAQGFYRAAGAIAGVILEKHLRAALDRNQIVLRKAEPTINDFNDHLKKAGVLDVPTWRKIQQLGDIRNLCGHSKHREPTPEEIDEIIEGVDALRQTLG